MHNVFSKNQKGGMCMIENEEVLQYVTTQEEDKEGLGRWSWMRLAGAVEYTRIIIAHMPCAMQTKAITNEIAQQKRY